MHNYETKKPTPTRRSQKQSTKKNGSTQKVVEGKSQPKGQKRMIQQTFKTIQSSKNQTEISPEEREILYSMKDLLKQTELPHIFDNCPKIKNLSERLSIQEPSMTNLINHCLKKYLQSKCNAMWGNRYAPSNIDQIQEQQFSKKIQEWIKDFYLFRKQTFGNESEFQFSQDQIDQQYSKSIQDRMRFYGWACRALILRGRTGVGKTTLLKAVAKSLKINWFEYASDLDQLLMMKERSGYTQSECVTSLGKEKREQSSKINDKLMKQNKQITKFFPFETTNVTEETLEVKKAKRLQIFRDFHSYFPNTKAEKRNTAESYFRFLNESIEKTKIPYALTTSEGELPLQKKIRDAYEKNDIVEFVEMTIEQLTNRYWVIFHIEKFLKLNLALKVSKSGLFAEVNEQVKDLDCESFVDKKIIEKVIIKANKKFPYINNFLQFRLKNLFEYSETFFPNVEESNKQERKNQFLEDQLNKLQFEVTEHLTGEMITNDIDWNLMNTEEVERKDQESFTLETIKNYCLASECRAMKDRKPLKSQYTLPIQVEENSKFYIPIQTHIEAKKKILKKVRKRFYEKQGRILQLKPPQLFYLPLSLKERRVTRNNRKQTPDRSQVNLRKVLMDKQIKYLKVNGYLFNHL